jgi:localization factor PodJL
MDAAAQRAAPPETPPPEHEEAPANLVEEPLDLVTVEDAYIAKARAATEANNNNPQAEDTETRPPQRTRPLRVASYVAAIMLLGAAGRMLNERAPEAEASAPPAAAAAVVHDPAAQTREAWALLAQGQTAEAITRLRPIGERGYAQAQYLLGKAYQRSADLALARQWTERAARSGHARAMHDLGVYYATGEGAPRDDAAAFRWFRQAAEFNVADSQYNLGVFYQEGRGVAPNAGEALMWFRIAATQGDEEATARAAALQAGLTPEQVRQAQARAETFRPRTPAAPSAP